MALGRVNFIIGTNIKSKQFTRCATCVRICGEINKLLLLDHWSLNALLIWEENQRCFGNGVCVCMHAHSRENEEKCAETEKTAQQSSVPSPQKGEIKSKIISRCQQPPGGEMGTEQLKSEVREKVHLQKSHFLEKKKETKCTETVPRKMHEANAQNPGNRRAQCIFHIKNRKIDIYCPCKVLDEKIGSIERGG